MFWHRGLTSHFVNMSLRSKLFNCLLYLISLCWILCIKGCYLLWQCLVIIHATIAKFSGLQFQGTWDLLCKQSMSPVPRNYTHGIFVAKTLNNTMFCHGYQKSLIHRIQCVSFLQNKQMKSLLRNLMFTKCEVMRVWCPINGKLHSS